MGSNNVYLSFFEKKIAQLGRGKRWNGRLHFLLIMSFVVMANSAFGAEDVEGNIEPLIIKIRSMGSGQEVRTDAAWTFLSRVENPNTPAPLRASVLSLKALGEIVSGELHLRGDQLRAKALHVLGTIATAQDVAEVTGIQIVTDLEKAVFNDQWPIKVRIEAVAALGSIVTKQHMPRIRDGAFEVLERISKNVTLADEIHAKLIAQLRSASTFMGSESTPIQGRAFRLLQRIIPEIDLSLGTRLLAVHGVGLIAAVDSSNIAAVAGLKDIVNHKQSPDEVRIEAVKALSDLKSGVSEILLGIHNDRNLPDAVRASAKFGSDVPAGNFENILQTLGRTLPDLRVSPESPQESPALPPHVTALDSIRDEPIFFPSEIREIAAEGLSRIAGKPSLRSLKIQFDTLQRILTTHQKKAEAHQDLGCPICLRVLEKLKNVVKGMSQVAATQDTSLEARNEALVSLQMLIREVTLPLVILVKVVNGLGSMAINQSLPVVTRSTSSQILQMILLNPRHRSEIRVEAAWRLGRIAVCSQETLPQLVEQSIFQTLWSVVQNNKCDGVVRLKAIEGLGCMTIGQVPEKSRRNAFRALKDILLQETFPDGMKEKAVSWVGSNAVGSRTEARREGALEFLTVLSQTEGSVGKEAVNILDEHRWMMRGGREEEAELPVVCGTREGFYEVRGGRRGDKIAKIFYEKLWLTGCGAPFHRASAISTSPLLGPLDAQGFALYLNDSMEMLYNLTTREVRRLRFRE